MTVRYFAAFFLAVAVPAFADELVPLTPEHWRGAPATLLESETGIPSTVIDEWHRQERERDPYPSIPGDDPARPCPCDRSPRRACP